MPDNRSHQVPADIADNKFTDNTTLDVAADRSGAESPIAHAIGQFKNNYFAEM